MTVKDMSTWCFRISASTVFLQILKSVLANPSPSIHYYMWQLGHIGHTTAYHSTGLPDQCNLSCWYCFWIRMSCMFVVLGLNPHGRQVHTSDYISNQCLIWTRCPVFIYSPCLLLCYHGRVDLNICDSLQNILSLRRLKYSLPGLYRKIGQCGLEY